MTNKTKRNIIQTWVCELGLRHQGLLLTAVRGCDTVKKEDPIKLVARLYRGVILEAHCGDPRLSQSFIQYGSPNDMGEALDKVCRSHDHYPHHYIMHLVHAAEVIGYHHPNESVRRVWCSFYEQMCHKFHMAPETRAMLDARLDADESTFGKAQ